jgi:hypothetical protein
MILEFSEQSIVHVEGLLAGRNDASIRTFTPVPAHYCGHSNHTTTWAPGGSGVGSWTSPKSRNFADYPKDLQNSAGFSVAGSC